MPRKDVLAGGAVRAGFGAMNHISDADWRNRVGVTKGKRKMKPTAFCKLCGGKMPASTDPNAPSPGVCKKCLNPKPRKKF